MFPIAVYLDFSVFAEKCFEKDDFLLVYRGELLSDKDGEKGSLLYKSEDLGNFLFYFTIDEI